MNDQPLLERLAVVESTFLGVEDHGIFTGTLRLRYDTSSGQGAGSYDLRHSDAGFKFVANVNKVCGAESWEKVPGCMLIALIQDGLVRGLRQVPTRGTFSFMFKDMYDKEDV